jgi:hypothetical protein
MIAVEANFGRKKETCERTNRKKISDEAIA